MNLATAEKYRDLADHAENLLVARETMLTKCTSPICAAAASCRVCVLPSTGCIFVKANQFLRAALNRLQMLRNACSIDFQLCRATDDEFLPYIYQIDELAKTMIALESTVEQLDMYTKRLGTLPVFVGVVNDNGPAGAVVCAECALAYSVVLHSVCVCLAAYF